MAWLSVNKNGVEEIHSFKPIKENGLWKSEYESDWGDTINTAIEIPKGSISKLIDKDLTWEDEPVEIN